MGALLWMFLWVTFLDGRGMGNEAYLSPIFVLVNWSYYCLVGGFAYEGLRTVIVV